MNLRIANKVARDPGRYRWQQRRIAANRLYRRASTFKDGEAGWAALSLRPEEAFVVDGQLDLRREKFLSQLDRGKRPVFEPGEIVVPPSNGKPVYRKDGQVHNFDALPFPGQKPYSMKKYLVATDGKFQGQKPPRQRRA